MVIIKWLWDNNNNIKKIIKDSYLQIEIYLSLLLLNYTLNKYYQPYSSICKNIFVIENKSLIVLSINFYLITFISNLNKFKI
jgi:hypothetical protein